VLLESDERLSSPSSSQVLTIIWRRMLYFSILVGSLKWNLAKHKILSPCLPLSWHNNLQTLGRFRSPVSHESTFRIHYTFLKFPRWSSKYLTDFQRPIDPSTWASSPWSSIELQIHDNLAHPKDTFVCFVPLSDLQF